MRMTTPWDGWMTAWQGGVALAETMRASAEVVAARLPMMASACASPMTGDWTELGRMVPEKVDAFGRAGAEAMTDLVRFQTDALATWASYASMLTAGRLPSVAQTGALLSRMAAGHARSSGAPGRALAPIRRTAMANASRLRG